MLNSLEIFSKVAEQNNLSLIVDDSDQCSCIIMEGLDNFKREDDCIFIGCKDKEVKSLLTSWLTGKFRGDYDLDFQLSRLLAARGSVVDQLATKIVCKEKWNGFNCKQMFLSYICNMNDFEKLLSKFLFSMPCDFRDGLFVSAMYGCSQNIDDILIDAFSKWYKSENWSPAGTGEDGWLEYFLKKWIKVYTLEKLEVPLRAYFDVCV